MDSLSLNDIRTWYEGEIQRFPLALRGQEGLKMALSRTLKAGGMTFTLQHNPQRAVSTLAKVDKESIQFRPCFLCEKNRPKEQACLKVLNRYEILVNPFPIFPFHLTIPDQEHQAQSILGRLQDFLSLARLLEGCSVFYNGPLAGASAPDHMHFQAVGEDLTASFSQSKEAQETILKEPGLKVMAETTPRHAFIMESTDKDKVEQCALRLIAGLPLLDGQTEPMMNLLTRYQDEKWTLILIGRIKHRPSCYFKDDASRMMVSPASVDLAGCLILPVREDFDRMTGAFLLSILKEVCLTDEITKAATAHLRSV